MNNGKKGAFAAVAAAMDGEEIRRWEQDGLTKRELLAAMAMQGILARATGSELPYKHRIAVSAVAAADALLAELEKE